jgi:hypothetical protein
MRGKRALLLDCLGGRALRRVRLVAVLLLELLLVCLFLPLLELLLELLLLKLLLTCLLLVLLLTLLLALLLAHLFLPLLLELLLLELLLGHLFLPLLLELLLGLLLLTLLTVTACLFLQGTPLILLLAAEYLGRECLRLRWSCVTLALLKRSPLSMLAFFQTTMTILWLLRERCAWN